MKITHNKVGQNLNLSDAGRADQVDQAKKNKSSPLGDKASLFDAPETTSAKVDLSDRALEARKIKDLALAAPDVDQVKVEKFRKLIDEGKYAVDAKAVADKMVDEQLMTAE